MNYIDLSYYQFAIPALIITIIAQIYVKYIYNKYSQIDSGKDITGLEAAKKIRDGENFPVSIETNQQSLGDHFDPTNNVVRLSRENNTSTSIANIAVVAHEFGHVQQREQSSFIYNVRRFMVPVTNIGTNIGYILFFIGIFLSMFQLAEVGLIFFSTSVVFSLVTLPVELNASSRGIKLISKYKLMDKDSMSGAKQVLIAAALTYLAGLLTSIANLLYYVNIFNNRKDRR